jgi:beta-1,4-mannosyl-glycoprotein beta-1,4-N-acetylglucosaminyltransferase
MIIDGFMFYNELDLLNYRLNILYDVVDYFVIVESMHTHTGKEKTLYFSENKHLFEKCNDKIIHVVVDDFPYKYPNINIQNNEQWRNENFQRNCISRGLERIELKDDDLIIISDLDEIPDPRTLLKIKNGEITVECNSLEMDFYYYNLHTKFIHNWIHSKILSYKKYKELNVSCTDIRFIHFPNIRSGWHLSYFGDFKFIVNKINNFTHQEYNNINYTDLSIVEYRVKNSKDIYGRDDPCYALEKVELKDNPYLPIEYEKYLINYI